MAKRISVVISQGQSQNPAKRNLEESIVTELMVEPGIDVTIVPHLYDLQPDGTGMVALKSISGNMIVVSWLFERAARWILDRNGIAGHAGPVLLQPSGQDEDEDLEEGDNEDSQQPDQTPRVLDSRNLPNRKIYCLDLKSSNNARDFVSEIKRILAETAVETVSLGIGAANSVQAVPPKKSETASGTLSPETVARFNNPTNGTALKPDGSGLETTPTIQGADQTPTDQTTTDENVAGQNVAGQAILNRIEEQAGRRWYPVIDYSRCTNCMECIDFCLFGVYGVDRMDTILVEQPDNCRKGCPACSRVCPENAIMFPQHKTPVIAGSPETGGSLKIDLSRLFGAPEEGKSAEEIAALERDEQLLAAGRQAVGRSTPTRKKIPSDAADDELDALVDELDELDL